MQQKTLLYPIKNLAHRDRWAHKTKICCHIFIGWIWTEVELIIKPDTHVNQILFEKEKPDMCIYIYINFSVLLSGEEETLL